MVRRWSTVPISLSYTNPPGVELSFDPPQSFGAHSGDFDRAVCAWVGSSQLCDCSFLYFSRELISASLADAIVRPEQAHKLRYLFAAFRDAENLLTLGRVPGAPTYSDAKANRDVRDFSWEIAHEAVTRRPPISLDTMVPRTEGYTNDVGVCDLSIVQGPFSVAPCQTLKSRFAPF
jgi:hypothetical protein